MRQLIRTENAEHRQRGTRAGETPKEFAHSGLLHAAPRLRVAAEVRPTGAQRPADPASHAAVRRTARDHHQPRE